MTLFFFNPPWNVFICKLMVDLILEIFQGRLRKLAGCVTDQTTKRQTLKDLIIPMRFEHSFRKLPSFLFRRTVPLAGWYGGQRGSSIGILKFQEFSRYQRLFTTWKPASLWEQRRLYKEKGWKPFEQWPVDNACVRFRGCGRTIQLYGDYIISQWIKNKRL